MDDLNLYDDLDEFQEQQEQKSKELQDVEEKYQQSLKTIEELKTENQTLQKKIKRIELSFQSLLDTARTEIQRKDKEIERLRKEKDDICFRRRIPQQRPRDFETQQVVEEQRQQTNKNPFKVKQKEDTTTLSQCKDITEEVPPVVKELHTQEHSQDRFTETNKRYRQRNDEHDDKYHKKSKNDDHDNEKYHEKTKFLKSDRDHRNKDRYSESERRHYKHEDDKRDLSKNRSARDRSRDKYSLKLSKSPERFNKRLERQRSRSRDKKTDHYNKRLESGQSTELKNAYKSAKSPERRRKHQERGRSRERTTSEPHYCKDGKRSKSRERNYKHKNFNKSSISPDREKDYKYNKDRERSRHHDDLVKPTTEKSSETFVNLKQDLGIQESNDRIVKDGSSLKPSDEQYNTVISQKTEEKQVNANISKSDKLKPEIEAQDEKKKNKNVKEKINEDKVGNTKNSTVPKEALCDELFGSSPSASNNSTCSSSIDLIIDFRKETENNLNVKETSLKLKSTNAHKLCTPSKLALFDKLFGPSPGNSSDTISVNETKKTGNNLNKEKSLEGKKSTTTHKLSTNSNLDLLNELFGPSPSNSTSSATNNTPIEVISSATTTPGDCTDKGISSRNDNDRIHDPNDIENCFISNYDGKEIEKTISSVDLTKDDDIVAINEDEFIQIPGLDLPVPNYFENFRAKDDCFNDKLKVLFENSSKKEALGEIMVEKEGKEEITIIKQKDRAEVMKEKDSSEVIPSINEDILPQSSIIKKSSILPALLDDNWEHYKTETSKLNAGNDKNSSVAKSSENIDILEIQIDTDTKSLLEEALLGSNLTMSNESINMNVPEHTVTDLNLIPTRSKESLEVNRTRNETTTVQINEQKVSILSEKPETLEDAKAKNLNRELQFKPATGVEICDHCENIIDSTKSCKSGNIEILEEKLIQKRESLENAKIECQTTNETDTEKIIEQLVPKSTGNQETLLHSKAENLNQELQAIPETDGVICNLSENMIHSKKSAESDNIEILEDKMIKKPDSISETLNRESETIPGTDVDLCNLSESTINSTESGESDDIVILEDKLIQKQDSISENLNQEPKSIPETESVICNHPESTINSATTWKQSNIEILEDKLIQKQESVKNVNIKRPTTKEIAAKKTENDEVFIFSDKPDTLKDKTENKDVSISTEKENTLEESKDETHKQEIVNDNFIVAETTLNSTNSSETVPIEVPIVDLVSINNTFNSTKSGELQSMTENAPVSQESQESPKVTKSKHEKVSVSYEKQEVLIDSPAEMPNHESQTLQKTVDDNFISAENTLNTTNFNETTEMIEVPIVDLMSIQNTFNSTKSSGLQSMTEIDQVWQESEKVSESENVEVSVSTEKQEVLVDFPEEMPNHEHQILQKTVDDSFIAAENTLNITNSIKKVAMMEVPIVDLMSSPCTSNFSKSSELQSMTKVDQVSQESQQSFKFSESENENVSVSSEKQEIIIDSPAEKANCESQTLQVTVEDTFNLPSKTLNSTNFCESTAMMEVPILMSKHTPDLLTITERKTEKQEVSVFNKIDGTEDFEAENQILEIQTREETDAENTVDSNKSSDSSVIIDISKVFIPDFNLKSTETKKSLNNTTQDIANTKMENKGHLPSTENSEDSNVEIPSQESQTLQETTDNVIAAKSTISTKLSENRIDEELLTANDATTKSHVLSERELDQQIIESKIIKTKTKTLTETFSTAENLVKDMSIECFKKLFTTTLEEAFKTQDSKKLGTTQESSKRNENLNTKNSNSPEKESFPEPNIVNEDVTIILNNDENLNKSLNTQQQILEIYSTEINKLKNNTTSEKDFMSDLTEKQIVEKMPNQLENPNKPLDIEDHGFEIKTTEKDSIKDIEDFVPLSNNDDSLNKSFNIEQQMFEMHGSEEIDVIPVPAFENTQHIVQIEKVINIAKVVETLSDFENSNKLEPINDLISPFLTPNDTDIEEEIIKNRSTDKTTVENASSSQDIPCFDLTEEDSIKTPETAVSLFSKDLEKSNTSFDIEQQMFEIHAADETDDKSSSELESTSEFDLTKEETIDKNVKAVTNNLENSNLLSSLSQESKKNIQNEEKPLKTYTDEVTCKNPITIEREESFLKKCDAATTLNDLKNSKSVSNVKQKSKIIIQDVQIISASLNNLDNSTTGNKRDDPKFLGLKSASRQQSNNDVKDTDIMIESATNDKTSNKDSTNLENMNESEKEKESIKGTDFIIQDVQILSNDLEESLVTKDNKSEAQIIEIPTNDNPAPKISENTDCYVLSDEEFTLEIDSDSETIATETSVLTIASESAQEDTRIVSDVADSVQIDESVEQLSMIEKPCTTTNNKISVLQQNSNEIQMTGLTVNTTSYETICQNSLISKINTPKKTSISLMSEASVKESLKHGLDRATVNMQGSCFESKTVNSTNDLARIDKFVNDSILNEPSHDNSEDNTVTQKTLSLISTASSKETRKPSRDLASVLTKELSKFFKSFEEIKTNPLMSKAISNIEFKSPQSPNKSLITSQDSDTGRIDEPVDQNSMIKKISIANHKAIQSKKLKSANDYQIPDLNFLSDILKESSKEYKSLTETPKSVRTEVPINKNSILPDVPTIDNDTNSLPFHLNSNIESNRLKLGNEEQMQDTSKTRKSKKESDFENSNQMLFKASETVDDVAVQSSSMLDLNLFKIDTNKCLQQNETPSLTETEILMKDPKNDPEITFDNSKPNKNQPILIDSSLKLHQNSPKSCQKLSSNEETPEEESQNKFATVINETSFNRNSSKSCQKVFSEEDKTVEETQNKFVTDETPNHDIGPFLKETENCFKEAVIVKKITNVDSKQNENQSELHCITSKFDQNHPHFLATVLPAEEQLPTQCSTKENELLESNLRISLEGKDNLQKQQTLESTSGNLQKDAATKVTETDKTRDYSDEGPVNLKEPPISNAYNNPEKSIENLNIKESFENKLQGKNLKDHIDTRLEGSKINKDTVISIAENNPTEKHLEINENVRLVSSQLSTIDVENLRLCLTTINNQDENSKGIEQSPKKSITFNQIELSSKTLIENPPNPLENPPNTEINQNVNLVFIKEIAQEDSHRPTEENEATKQLLDTTQSKCADIPLPKTNINDEDKETTLISSPLLKESDLFNKPSQLPSIPTNSPTPPNFSGLFSKKSLETTTKDDFIKSKKKSPYFTSTKLREYILPAASVLCNIDNLENATKANKKLHWELLDNKNEMTEIEDDTDVDNTDEERNRIFTEAYAKDMISWQEVQPRLTPFKCTESLNSDSDTISEDETRYGSLSALNIDSGKQKMLEHRRKTIDTVPITCAVAYYKNLEEIKLKQEREAIKLWKKECKANKLKKKEARKQLNFVGPKVKKHKNCKHTITKKLKAKLKASNPVRVRNVESLMEVGIVKETVVKQTKFSIVLPKKQRGRPKKVENVVKATKVKSFEATKVSKIEEISEVVRVAKKRGRPKKIREDLNEINNSEASGEHQQVTEKLANSDTERQDLEDEHKETEEQRHNYEDEIQEEDKREIDLNELNNSKIATEQENYKERPCNSNTEVEHREKENPQTENEKSRPTENVQQLCVDIPDNSLVSKTNKHSRIENEKSRPAENVQQLSVDIPHGSSGSKTNKNPTILDDNKIYQEFLSNYSKPEKDTKMSKHQQKPDKEKQKEEQLLKKKEQQQSEVNDKLVENVKEKQQLTNQEELEKKKEQHQRKYNVELFEKEKEKQQFQTHQEKFAKKKEQQQREDKTKLFENEKQKVQLNHQEQLKKQEQQQLIEKKDQLRKAKDHQQREDNDQNFEKEIHSIDIQIQLFEKKDRQLREEQETPQLNNEVQHVQQQQREDNCKDNKKHQLENENPSNKKKEQPQRKEQEKLQFDNEDNLTLRQLQQLRAHVVQNLEINHVAKANKQPLDDRSIYREFLSDYLKFDREQTENVADAHEESSSSEIECSQENPTRRIKPNTEENTVLKVTVERTTTAETQIEDPDIEKSYNASIVYHKEHSSDGNNSSVAENSEPECNKYLQYDEYPSTSKDTKISEKSIQTNETNYSEQELPQSSQASELLETQEKELAVSGDCVNKIQIQSLKDEHPKEFPTESPITKSKTLLKSSLKIIKKVNSPGEMANNKKQIISLEEIGIKVKPFKGHLSTFRIPKINKDLEVTKGKSWKLETYTEVTKDNKQQNEGARVGNSKGSDKEKQERLKEKTVLQHKEKLEERPKEIIKGKHLHYQKLNEIKGDQLLKHKENKNQIKTENEQKGKKEETIVRNNKNVYQIGNATTNNPQISKDKNHVNISQHNPDISKELQILTYQEKFVHKPKDEPATSHSSIKSRRKSLSHKRKLFSPDVYDQEESLDGKFPDTAQNNKKKANDNDENDQNLKVNEKLKEIALEWSHKTTDIDSCKDKNSERIIKDGQKNISQSIILQSRLIDSKNEQLADENDLENNENQDKELIEDVKKIMNKYKDLKRSKDNNLENTFTDKIPDVNKKSSLKPRRKSANLQKRVLDSSSEDENTKAASQISQENPGPILLTVKERRKSTNSHRRILDSSCDEENITDNPVEGKNMNLEVSQVISANECAIDKNYQFKPIQSLKMRNKSAIVEQTLVTKEHELSHVNDSSNIEKINPNLIAKPITSLRMRRKSMYQEKVTLNDNENELSGSLDNNQVEVLKPQPVKPVKLRRKSMYQERSKEDVLQEEWENVSKTIPSTLKHFKIPKKSDTLSNQQEDNPNIQTINSQNITNRNQQNNVLDNKDKEDTNPIPKKSIKMRRKSMYQEDSKKEERNKEVPAALGSQNSTDKNHIEDPIQDKSTAVKSLRMRRKSVYQEREQEPQNSQDKNQQQEEIKNSNQILEPQCRKDKNHVKAVDPRNEKELSHSIPVKSLRMRRKSVYQEREQQAESEDNNHLEAANPKEADAINSPIVKSNEEDSINAPAITSIKILRKSVYQEKQTVNDSQEGNNQKVHLIPHSQSSKDEIQLEVGDSNNKTELNNTIPIKSLRMRRKSMYQEREKEIVESQDNTDKNPLGVIVANERDATDPPPLKIRRRSMYQEKSTLAKQPEGKEIEHIKEVTVTKPSPITSLRMRRKSMYHERGPQEEFKEEEKPKIVTETSHKSKGIEKENILETEETERLNLNVKQNIETHRNTDLNLKEPCKNTNGYDSDSSVVFTHKKSIRMRRKSVNQLRVLDSSDEEQEEPISHIKNVIQTEEKTPLTAKKPRKRRVVKVLSSSQGESTAIQNLQISDNCTQISNTSPSLISPTLNHPIFHTEVIQHQKDTTPILPPTPNKQFEEIDTKLNEIFQSPQYVIDDKTTQSSDISTLSLIPATLNNSQSNITIEETIVCNQANDQSSMNTTHFTDLSTPLNDSSSSLAQNLNDVKHLSLGTSEYRFEKVSDNVVNLFISRKRKRKRNN